MCFQFVFLKLKNIHVEQETQHKIRKVTKNKDKRKGCERENKFSNKSKAEKRSFFYQNAFSFPNPYCYSVFWPQLPSLKRRGLIEKNVLHIFVPSPLVYASAFDNMLCVKQPRNTNEAANLTNNKESQRMKAERSTQ